jgi:hypothetical protein
VSGSWLKQPGECHDRRGVPIYPGDLLRSFHFRGKRRKMYYLYHVAILDVAAGGMRMIPASHLEPTNRDAHDSRGGDPLLSDSLTAIAEVIDGYGPEPYIDFKDRPRKKAARDAAEEEGDDDETE